MRPHTNKNKKPVKSKGKSQPHIDDEASDDNTAFETPDRENETDYGLEFTTSRLTELNTTPRRCSTLRKKFSKSHHRDVETSTDITDAENRPPKNTSNRGTSDRRPQQTSAPPNKNISTHRVHSNQQQMPSKAVSRRKQNKPEHRIKKMHREMERLQTHSGYMIPRLPFSRLVREIMMEHTVAPFMITVGALEAIQTATEMYLTQRFQDAYLLTQYRSRVTLEVRDMALVAYFCKTYGNL